MGKNRPETGRLDALSWSDFLDALELFSISFSLANEDKMECPMT